MADEKVIKVAAIMYDVAMWDVVAIVTVFVAMRHSS